MIDCDLIIKADYVVTMNDMLDVVENGAIAVSNGNIVAVDAADRIMAGYWSDRILGGPHTVVFPGLVNTHTHSPMVYFRGLGDDLPLKVWLEEHIWPAENRWLSHEFVRDAAELACLEMLKAGITVFSDMYFYGDAIAESVKKAGMRAVIGAGVLDFPSATARTADEYLARAERFIRDWRKDALVVPAVAPHSPYTCSPETLKRAKELSDTYEVPLNLHLAETEWEVRELLGRYGRRPIELMHDHGILGQRVLAAHCVWASDEEIDILAETETGVAHCIKSNLKLASGIAPVVKMLSAGVKVAFGTDGAASNNDLDILGEMATAARVHKAISGDPTVLNARQALSMATRSGAGVLGLDSIAGSIQTGRSADLVIAELNRPHLVPLYDIYSQIVYAMRASDVSTVLVNGRVLLEQGRPTTLDEDAIYARARSWAEKIGKNA
ncbi:MAG: S-adenosylhomocysteine deaminase [Thermodesulfovibrio sp.]|nr:S-adenosylhomocysteine deaminase [Thermodesulfovibrio sp.]